MQQVLTETCYKAQKWSEIVTHETDIERLERESGISKGTLLPALILVVAGIIVVAIGIVEYLIK